MPQRVQLKVRPHCGHKQRVRDGKARERLRNLEDKKIQSIRDELSLRLEGGASHPQKEGDASPNTHGHFMRSLRYRIDRAVTAALNSCKPETAYFGENFRKLFNAFCRHVLALKADAEAFYIERELRHVLDPKLAHFSGVLRSLDRHPVDAKTFEAILSHETAIVARIDMYQTARSVIHAVERRLVEIALTGRRVSNRSAKGYQAVMCKISSEKRTNCFLIFEVTGTGALSRIVALQSPKKFAKHQKKAGKPKGDISRRGQRYANRPEKLRNS